MLLAKDWKDFELLDSGFGEKLERWGGYVLRRPDPQAVWPTDKDSRKWLSADAAYHRSASGGGSWELFRKLPDRWPIGYKGLRFYVQLMQFKHTGIFPEQAANWDWAMARVSSEAERRRSGGGSKECGSPGRRGEHNGSGGGSAGDGSGSRRGEHNGSGGGCAGDGSSGGGGPCRRGSAEKGGGSGVCGSSDSRDSAGSRSGDYSERGAAGSVRVLNLFAYTGAATVAAASAGATVTHVDASRGMVQKAKANAAFSGVPFGNVRYIVDDAVKFVRREIKRGSRYDAVMMDPPSYGRGPGGELWKSETHLYGLVELCCELLSDDPLFFLINAYTTGLSATAIGNMLSIAIKDRRGGAITSDEIGLMAASRRIVLPCGCFARWEARRGAGSAGSAGDSGTANVGSGDSGSAGS
jgi:hypothetical protein